MKTIRLFLWGFFFCCFMLASCTSLQLSKQQQSYQKITAATRYQKLNALQHWEIKGAFSIQAPNSKPVIAHYQWQQISPNHYQIHIASALNAYTVFIVSETGSVRLWKNNHSYYTAPTPEALMQETLHFSLPITDLFYWIRGIPAPTMAQTKYDAFGHLLTLQQNGWLITYSHYATVKNLDLPQWINLQHNNIHVRLIVKRWVL